MHPLGGHLASRHADVRLHSGDDVYYDDAER